MSKFSRVSLMNRDFVHIYVQLRLPWIRPTVYPFSVVFVLVLLVLHSVFLSHVQFCFPLCVFVSASGSSEMGRIYVHSIIITIIIIIIFIIIIIIISF